MSSTTTTTTTTTSVAATQYNERRSTAAKSTIVQLYDYSLVTKYEISSFDDDCFANLAILILLEICDFVCLVMEPFFRWLPLLGLFYVLVPYYNQVYQDMEEFEREDAEFGEYDEPTIDFDNLDWNRH